MAAPINVRVEAISITATVLRWTDGSGAANDIYRAVAAAGPFVKITGETGVANGVQLYTDVGLTPETRYWYKISNDAGATFSSTVNVVTHTCSSGGGSQAGISFPRFEGDEQQSDLLNQFAEAAESLIGSAQASGACEGCIVNGAIVINCTDGCFNFVIEAIEDINSISIIGCDEYTNTTIDFIVPPNTTRGICGFPAGWGFTGDECTQAPIAGGPDGRTVRAAMSRGRGGPGTRSRVGYNSGRGGGGAGGAGCACTPGAEGQLTIRSCSSNNSLGCNGSKQLKLVACGGRGPYTWSKTGNVTLSTTSGNTTIVKPPTNSGPSVAGQAYNKGICGVSEAHPHNGGHSEARYGCDDDFQSCSSGSTGATNDRLAFLSDTESCAAHAGHAVTNCTGLLTVTCTCTGATGSECATAQSCGGINDTRTAPMIAAGCAPCALNEGATVTVTDSVGVSVTIILRA